MKRLFLLLVLTVIPITVAANTTETVKPCSLKPFMTTTTVGRVHLAGWCEERSLICIQEGREVKENCQYRGEDGGSPYSSCECQSLRYYRDCMVGWGCNVGDQYFRIYEDYPHCFIQ